jgi:hypothetical protein
MSSQKPSSTPGNEFLKASQSKKVSRTVGQPLLVRISVAYAPSTTTVDRAEIAAPRAARRRPAASRTARRSGFSEAPARPPRRPSTYR